jgi:nitroreductase
MLVSRIYGYDTCPIGGFDKKNINQSLGIDPRYVPVLLISVGKADDKGYESLRFDANEVTNYID